MLQEWTRFILKSSAKQPMKKIKRIAPAKPKTMWDVRFRTCATGVAVDITLADYPDSKSPLFKCHRGCYLIPFDWIQLWANEHSKNAKKAK